LTGPDGVPVDLDADGEPIEVSGTELRVEIVPAAGRRTA